MAAADQRMSFVHSPFLPITSPFRSSSWSTTTSIGWVANPQISYPLGILSRPPSGPKVLARITLPQPPSNPLRDGRPVLPLPRCPIPDDNSTIAWHATPTTLHHLTVDARARGIRLVEVKYPYIRSMFTLHDYSEYDSSRSPEHPDPWETHINRGVHHSLMYGLFSLPKLCFSTCSSVPLTDLSIGVPLADTPLMSPLLRGVSLLQAIKRRTTAQG
ncbi:hypothetical protein TIFTF001_027544 [Ficus carica]|uniref:Uncharacterized protein n=1 Tax=Ficus carica TaxID=3494 RepID=A0AA88IYQ5_FICCA|nr:hypothetical protein TIFTF001_027544 [Ficus carica]